MAQGDFAKAALADPVLVLCAHYGDLLRRCEALMGAWSDHEAWLADNRDWFTLGRAEQRAVPEGRLLDAIDDDLDACTGECVRVMRRLRAVPARTLAGAVAKLSSVAYELQARLLRRARRFTAALDVTAGPTPGVEAMLVAGDALDTPRTLALNDASGRLSVLESAPGDGAVLRTSALLDERSAEAAKRLGVSRRTLQRYIETALAEMALALAEPDT